MEFPLISLPAEVLSTVFSFLSVEDRLRACLVCKYWYQLINCKLFLSDVSVHIHYNHGIDRFIPVTRKFLNYSFHNILILDDVYKILKTLDYVQCMSFTECTFWDKKSFVIDSTIFKNLNELRIVNFKEPVGDLWFLFPSLQSLSKLELQGRNLICDTELSFLQNSIKHLKILTIDTDLVSEYKVYRRFYPQGITYEENPSKDIFSFVAVKSFISENVNSLSELNINCITSTALKELSSVKGLNLKKIKVSLVGEIHDSLKSLFLTQINLKVFGLTCMHLNENVTELMLLYLPNVENLSITDCNISTTSVKDLLKLPKLQCLKISALTYDADKNKSLSDIKSDKIRSFDLYNISRLSNTLFSEKLLNLTFLNLKLCNITDSDLHVISECLLKLQFLDLSYNEKISDHGLTTSLIMKEKKVSPFDKTINNLKLLKYLDLSKCLVTATGLITIKFPSLQYLLVYGYQLTEECVSILYSQNPNLISLIYNKRYFVEGKEIALRNVKKYF